MNKSYKFVKKTLDWKDAARDAIDEIQSLADEMNDWSSNMQGTNLENTSKYEDICAAAQQLEDAVYELQSIEEIDLDDLEDGDIKYDEAVHVDKKKTPSRSIRTDNIITMLNEAVDFVSNLIAKAEVKNDEDAVAIYEEIIDIINNTTDILEHIEYPGAF